MSADDTRRYFKKFVKAWNNFELDESYYKGIRPSQLSHKDTTKYQWGFVKKIGREDQNKVESIRDTIDTMTNVRFANEVSRHTGVATASALASSGADASSSSAGTSRRPLGPSMPSTTQSTSSTRSRWPRTADEVAEQEEQRQRQRLQERAKNKADRRAKDADLEELVPKATGREAILEKRRAQTAYHRRERSPDVELPEDVLMGTGGDDDYKTMLTASRRKQEAREVRRHGGPSGSGGAAGSLLEAKQAAFKEKEAKQLEAFRQLWAQSQAAKGL
ncbi:hypothetical protein BGZ94_001840 [Podila epigama]|nr:hypothetical protein BGZ94_001840 [Podila epigama]